VPPQLDAAVIVNPETNSPAMLQRNAIRDSVFMSSSFS